MYLTNGPIITGASGKGLLSRPRQRRETKSILDKATSILEELEEQVPFNRGKYQNLRKEEKDSKKNIVMQWTLKNQFTVKLSSA